MWRAASFAIALTFFSQVASAQQCTTDARRVVDELYRHMLERGADAGSQPWQNQLSGGQLTVKELVRAIAKSQEHNQKFIRRENGEDTPFIRSAGTLYRHILGRQPDPDGARANAGGLERQGIGPVVDALVDSAEYNQQYGNFGVPGSGGLSFCAPGNNQSASTQPAANARGNYRFRSMDRNNDGSITRDEWEGSRVSFSQHDWNGDGVLSGEEIMPGRFRQGRRGEDEDFDRMDRFEDLDVNNNGRIEVREWHADDNAFHQLDRNGDNYLSRAELAGQTTGAVPTTVSSTLVYVDADNRWTDTGIDLQAGQTIVVNAQGSVKLSDDVNDSATPAGTRSGRRASAESPVRQGPAGGLIGRVGNGAPVFLGQGGSIRAATAGRLYLGVNDDYLSDNTGEYRVNVTVRGR